MSEKTIFITGAASGIGYATAQRFARAGWFVGAFDMNTDGLSGLVEEFGEGRVLAGAIDVTDDASVSAAMQAFESATEGRMNALFNSAGVLQIGAFEEVDLAQHMLHMNVNFGGVMRVSVAALPMLKATPEACIINMSSASADYGVPDFASYSATKFAVRGLTEALNLEWRRHGVYVCDVMPPFVRTAMLEEAPEGVTSIKRLGVKLDATNVADTVWQAAGHRGKPHWPVGWQFKFIYYSGQVLPVWIKRLVMGFISGR